MSGRREPRTDAEIAARNDRFAENDPHAEGRRLHEEACAAANCSPGIEHPTRGEVLAFLHGEGPLDGKCLGEGGGTHGGFYWWRRHLAVLEAPIPMVLHCPRCGAQHIDQATDEWPNPPHRSHLCSAEGCGTIWRPADVPTVGVEAIETRSTSDNWPPIVCACPATGHLPNCPKVAQERRPLCSYAGCHNWTGLVDGYCSFHRFDPAVFSDVEPQLLPPCNLAPVGWRCTRGAGHDGPCAAVRAGMNYEPTGGLVERQAVLDALADYPQAQMAVRRIPHAQG